MTMPAPEPLRVHHVRDPITLKGLETYQLLGDVEVKVWASDNTGHGWVFGQVRRLLEMVARGERPADEIERLKAENEALREALVRR